MTTKLSANGITFNDNTTQNTAANSVSITSIGIGSVIFGATTPGVTLAVKTLFSNSTNIQLTTNTTHVIIGTTI